MFIRVGSKGFTLEQIEGAAFSGNGVQITFQTRTVPFQDRADMEALSWLFTDEGMSWVREHCLAGFCDLPKEHKKWKDNKAELQQIVGRVSELPREVTGELHVHSTVSGEEIPPKKKAPIGRRKAA